MFQHQEIEILFILKMVNHHAFGGARFLRDLLHAGTVQSILGKSAMAL
jgi:hypothetical protein